MVWEAKCSCRSILLFLFRRPVKRFMMGMKRADFRNKRSAAVAQNCDFEAGA